MKSLFFSFGFLLISANIFSQADLQPTDKEALVKFVIVDPKGIPEQGAILKIESADKTFVREAVADIDGKCPMLIPEGLSFNITVHRFNMDFDMGEGKIPIKTGSQIVNFKLKIELVLKYAEIITMDKLYFEPNKFDVSAPESIAALKKLLDMLNSNPKMKIEIAGHTDNVGDDLANLQLSQRRADAVRKYLIEKGIDENRLKAKGYGETEPVTSNDTAEGRSLNRRTEVRVIEE